MLTQAQAPLSCWPVQLVSRLVAWRCPCLTWTLLGSASFSLFPLSLASFSSAARAADGHRLPSWLWWCPPPSALSPAIGSPFPLPRCLAVWFWLLANVLTVTVPFFSVSSMSLLLPGSSSPSLFLPYFCSIFLFLLSFLLSPSLPRRMRETEWPCLPLLFHLGLIPAANPNLPPFLGDRRDFWRHLLTGRRNAMI